MLRQAIRVCGIQSLCMNKLDVLSALPKIGVCCSYKLKGGRVDHCDLLTRELESVEPEYREFDGWENFDFDKVKGKKDLPKNARLFIDFIEESTGVPIDIISLGPSREQTLVLKKCFE